MGEAGRRRVEDRFTWDKVAVETLSVYNEVTE
jgi:glycosyltransferase involved in cell wall biosynthesis